MDMLLAWTEKNIIIKKKKIRKVFFIPETVPSSPSLSAFISISEWNDKYRTKYTALTGGKKKADKIGNEQSCSVHNPNLEDQSLFLNLQ